MVADWEASSGRALNAVGSAAPRSSAFASAPRTAPRLCPSTRTWRDSHAASRNSLLPKWRTFWPGLGSLQPIVKKTAARNLHPRCCTRRVRLLGGGTSPVPREPARFVVFLWVRCLAPLPVPGLGKPQPLGTEMRVEMLSSVR